MNKTNKIREGHIQINDEHNYKPLVEPMLKEMHSKVMRLINYGSTPWKTKWWQDEKMANTQSIKNTRVLHSNKNSQTNHNSETNNLWVWLSNRKEVTGVRPCVHKRANSLDSLVRLMNQGNSKTVRVSGGSSYCFNVNWQCNFITRFIRNGNKIMPFYEKTWSVRCTN